MSTEHKSLSVFNLSKVSDMSIKTLAEIYDTSERKQKITDIWKRFGDSTWMQDCTDQNTSKWHQLVNQALAAVMDLPDSTLVHTVAGYDMPWILPTSTSGICVDPISALVLNINKFHHLSEDIESTDVRTPLEVVLSYLFCTRDVNTNERWFSGDKSEQKYWAVRAQAHRYLRATYKNVIDWGTFILTAMRYNLNSMQAKHMFRMIVAYAEELWDIKYDKTVYVPTRREPFN